MAWRQSCCAVVVCLCAAGTGAVAQPLPQQASPLPAQTPRSQQRPGPAIRGRTPPAAPPLAALPRTQGTGEMAAAAAAAAVTAENTRAPDFGLWLSEVNEALVVADFATNAPAVGLGLA